MVIKGAPNVTVAYRERLNENISLLPIVTSMGLSQVHIYFNS